LQGLDGGARSHLRTSLRSIFSDFFIELLLLK
jgi:hypothetical protein